MIITIDKLQKIFPATKKEQLEKFVAPLNNAFDKHKISNPMGIRVFIAQVGHESAGFNSMSENLNYSEQGLLKIFKKYFNATTAKQYARKPEAIANKVYANRMGNGNEASGDGWKYRGAGLIQLTGKFNHSEFAKSIGMELDKASEYARTPEGAVESAIWFFYQNNLWPLANVGGVTATTKKINGGTIGLEDRINLFNKAKILG